jgi:hypothetical protein
LAQFPSCRLKSSGTDYSGRFWYRGVLTPAAIRAIADQFFSVQSLYPPLLTAVAGSARSRAARDRQPPEPKSALTVTGELPVVGVVDTGVPEDHVVLSRYRRGRAWVPG